MEVVTADKGLAGSALGLGEGGAVGPWHLQKHHSWIQLFTDSPTDAEYSGLSHFALAEVELDREISDAEARAWSWWGHWPSVRALPRFGLLLSVIIALFYCGSRHHSTTSINLHSQDLR